MPERKMKQYQSKIDELSGHLMAQELALGLRKRQRTKEAKSVFTNAISWLVTEALAANIGNSTGSFSVSRNKNHYTKENPDRTGLVPWGLSYETAVSDPKTNTGALESLLDGGFLRETRRGNYNRGGDLSKSKVTQYAATKKLLEYCKDVQDQSLFIPKPDTETIILKAPVPNESDQVEKALREYPDTPSSNQMREYLKLINQNMLSHWYDLYVADDTYVLMQKEIATRRARNKQDKDKLQPVNLSKRTLRRVFGRGSFERGGRFYGGWWQNIPSAYRSVISINGKRTIEMDYSQYHPNILYNLHQAVLDNEDAYDRILGHEHRDLSKQIFNACLNASKELKRPPKGMKISHTGKTWKDIKRCLFTAHPQIKEAFFTDQGMELQYRDSQMAEQVMLAFAKAEKPILPVHDSFLVLIDDKELLLEEMQSAYTSVFGKNIVIDTKKAKFMLMPPPDHFEVDEMTAYFGWLERNEAADQFYGRCI